MTEKCDSLTVLQANITDEFQTFSEIVSDTPDNLSESDLRDGLIELVDKHKVVVNSEWKYRRR